MTARFADSLFKHRLALTLLFALLTAMAAVAATQARFTTGFAKLIPSQHAFVPAFERFKSIPADGGEILLSVTARDGLRLPDDTVSAVSVVLASTVHGLNGTEALQTLAELRTDAAVGGTPIEPPTEAVPDDAEGAPDEAVPEGEAPLPDTASLSSAGMAAGPSLNVHVQRGPEALFRVSIADVKTADGLAAMEEKAKAAVVAAIGADDYMIQTAVLSYRIPWTGEDWQSLALILAGGFAIMTALALVFTRSWLLGGLVMCLSLIAIIWQIGIVRLLGLTMHGLALPALSMSLVISVLIGVEQTSRLTRGLRYGLAPEEAAKATLRFNLLPGGVGLLVAAGAFLCCLVVPIPIVADIAIAGSVGMAVLAFTHLLLLPVLAGQIGLGERFIHRTNRIARFRERASGPARLLSQTRVALMAVGLFLVIGNIAAFEGTERRIGLEPNGTATGLHALIAPRGDFEQLAERFGTNPRSFVAYVETEGPGCPTEASDRTSAQLISYMKSLDFVRGVVPRGTLASGDGCSALAVEIVLRSWNSRIAERLSEEIVRFRNDLGAQGEGIVLAGGPVALMAAIDDVARGNELLMLLLPGLVGSVIFAALFRSWPAWLGWLGCYALAMALGYWGLALLGHGLDAVTLVSFGLGATFAGVPAAFFIARMREFRSEGYDAPASYLQTCEERGWQQFFWLAGVAAVMALWALSPFDVHAEVGLTLAAMTLTYAISLSVILPAVLLIAEALAHHEGTTVSQTA